MPATSQSLRTVASQLPRGSVLIPLSAVRPGFSGAARESAGRRSRRRSGPQKQFLESRDVPGSLWFRSAVTKPLIHDPKTSPGADEKEQNQKHREFAGLFIDPVPDGGKYRRRQNHLDTQSHVTAHALIVFAQIHLDSLATTSVRATKSM